MKHFLFIASSHSNNPQILLTLSCLSESSKAEGYAAVHWSPCAALHRAIFFSSYLQWRQTEVAQEIMALKGKYPAWVALWCVSQIHLSRHYTWCKRYQIAVLTGSASRVRKRKNKYLPADNHWICYSAPELQSSLLTPVVRSMALWKTRLEISFPAKVTYKNYLHLYFVRSKSGVECRLQA